MVAGWRQDNWDISKPTGTYRQDLMIPEKGTMAGGSLFAVDHGIWVGHAIFNACAAVDLIVSYYSVQ